MNFNKLIEKVNHFCLTDDRAYYFIKHLFQTNQLNRDAIGLDEADFTWKDIQDSECCMVLSMRKMDEFLQWEHNECECSGSSE